MSKTKKLYCILTNDVETTSIVNHCLSEGAGDLVLTEGMPRLLELYKKYNVKSTFFFNGDIIRQHPQVVSLILNDNHEVASHGWVHDSDKAFDVLTYDQQIEHLTLSKSLLEELSGKKIVSFRAPALRINKDTAKALQFTGYEVDSSVSSQRMDMFLSFGAIKKLSWFFAPRLPYNTSEKKLWRKGDGKIFEIPVSAIGLAYIGTTLRIMPTICQLLRFMLHLETRCTGKPIVFLTHPNEFIDEEINMIKTKRRAKNIVSYLLGDLLRRKLKLKNLGSKAISLYESEIAFFHRKGYEFITCEDYFNLIKTTKTN